MKSHGESVRNIYIYICVEAKQQAKQFNQQYEKQERE